MLVIFLLLCCVFSIISGGGYYIHIYGLPKPKPKPEQEPEQEPDEEELETIQDKAYDREMKKIVTDMTDERKETSAKQQKLAVALKALERAKFNAGNVGNAFKTVSEASKKLAEAKAQILVYEGLANESTDDDEKAIWQQAVDQTQKKIDFFQATYDEAKKGADEAAAALREKAAAEQEAAKERARLAEQRRVEAAAAKEAERKAQELNTLKEGCKSVTWENVYVGGRPGADLSFWDRTSITTGGTTITKGNKKITTERTPKKTTVQENQVSGRDRRGSPIYTWRNKASYNGYIALKGDKVGWYAMNKKPDNRQSQTCKTYGKNCAYEKGDFNELHNFNDGGKEIKFVIVDNHMGVMQAQTGKFYSIPDKKVMDNPLTSDCKSKLDYK
jgi:hypothetical protein